MQLTPFIISLVVFIVSTIWVAGNSFSSALAPAKASAVWVQWLLLVIMLSSLGASIYFGVTNASSESRTIAGTWDQTPSATGSSASAVWANGAVSSDLAPGWTVSTDTSSMSPQTLINNWLRRTVNNPVVGLVPTAPDDVRSILVRKKNGSTAEIPIMSFFKKLHEDALLAWRQSKDYTDEKIANDPNLIRKNSFYKLRQTDNATLSTANNIPGGQMVLNQTGGGQLWKLTD